MRNFRAQDMPSSRKGKGKDTDESSDSAPQATQQSAPAPGPQPEPQPQPVDEGADEVPAGTTAEILQWVGDDKGRAQRALDTEQSHSSPRHGLTTELTKLLSAE